MTMQDYVISIEDDCYIGRVASVDTNRALILAESPEVIQTLTVSDLVAIQGATPQEFLVGIIEKVKRSVGSPILVEPESEDGEDEDFDATQFALSTGLGAAGAGVLGRYLPKLTEKLGRKKALMKQEAFEKADMLPTVQIKETSTIIENLLPEEIVASRVNKAREELEVNGTVDINLQGKRTKTKAERDSIKVPKKTDKGYQTKRELKDNLSEEEVIKEFGFQDFEVNKVGPNKFIGKKTIDTKVDVSNPEVGRTKFQERIAQIKRSIFDDSGLGDKFKVLRSRFDVAPRVMEQNITRNFNRLQNALKKEHEGEVSTELYETMDKAFRGDTEALDIVAERTGTETVSALKEMRNQIQSLQKRLL